MTEPGLRVAVLTRTGRRSGQAISAGIAAGRHTLCGILAEKRSSLLREAIRRDSLVGAFRRFGVGFLVARVLQVLRPKPPGASAPSRQDSRLPSVTVVDRLNSGQAIGALTDWRPDVLVVANAPVLKADVFACCRIGAVNFHSGRLPEYGGVESEFWALHDGASEAWVTVHRVTAALDAGEILAERAVPVSDSDTPESLHDACIETGVALVADVLDMLARGGVDAIRHPGPARLRSWPTTRQRLDLAKRLRSRRRQATKR